MASFPVLCFVVLSAFLGCLGLFALALTKVVAPDGRGHARGLGGGIAAVLALLLLCGLGLAGLAATVGAIALGSVADWNPIRRIEIERAPGARDGGAAHSSRNEGDRSSSRESAVSARVTVRDDAGAEWAELLDDLVDVDLSELGEDMRVHRHAAEDGGEFTVYEFRLPISEKELARFERDALDGLELRLPERVDIELESAR